MKKQNTKINVDTLKSKNEFVMFICESIFICKKHQQSIFILSLKVSNQYSSVNQHSKVRTFKANNFSSASDNLLPSYH